jgi:hypothetical protein
MIKLAICMLVLVFSTALGQTDSKQVTVPEDDKATLSKDKGRASADSKNPSTKKLPTPKPQKKKPATEPSTYVNGKAVIDDTEFGFGYTPTNCTIFHSFHIRNEGTDTLDIVQVRPG